MVNSLFRGSRTKAQNSIGSSNEVRSSLPDNGGGSSGYGGLANKMGIADVMLGRAASAHDRRRIKSAPVQENVQIPSWIKIDAHVSYMSRSLGRVVEAIVEMVDTSRMEVEISFPDGSPRKLIPFAVIGSAGNPIIGVWQSKVVPQEKRSERSRSRSRK
mmetsp:Transcript_105860/g.167049  ORF Transcript_105860/g.167049 Transcript_105860/m.167049 type:complete len:159 (+) Transcript_105860:30-506(+)